MSINRISLIFYVTLLLALPALADPVGQIGLLEGTVTITKASGKRVFVAEGSVIDSGDVVVTGNNSKAMLAFTDGGKIALRPNTVFQIAEYAYKVDQPEADNAFFKLVKGGLRTVTGLVGKRGNKDAYRLGNNTATIGIRGTEYLARVCDLACQNEVTEKDKGRPILHQQPVARVVLLKGTAFSEGVAIPTGKRAIVEGEPLYLGDTVSTGKDSFLGILFTDRSRMVLGANSSFNVNTYQYAESDPEASNMAIELLKGSARVVTGLIGKLRPTHVNYRTATATIGIRGTDFDMACLASGSANSGEVVGDAAASTVECDQALTSVVRHGAVEMDSGKGQQRIEADQAGYTDAPNTAPVMLSKAPKLFDDAAPLPSNLTDDVGAQFGNDAQNKVDPGMYVSVIEGKVEVKQGSGKLNLLPGESGFANASGATPQRLLTAPSNVNYDPFLKGVKFNAFSCGLK